LQQVLAQVVDERGDDLAQVQRRQAVIGDAGIAQFQGLAKQGGLDDALLFCIFFGFSIALRHAVMPAPQGQVALLFLVPARIVPAQLRLANGASPTAHREAETAKAHRG